MSNLVDNHLQYMKPFLGSSIWHKWTMLAVISALCERRIWLPMGDAYPLFPNIFVALVGPPGSGKGYSVRFGKQRINELNEKLPETDQGIILGPNKVTPAGLIDIMQNCGKHFWWENEKHDYRSLFLYVEEFSSLVVDIGGGSVANDMLDWYDAQPMFHKHTKGDGSVRLKNCSVSILTGTTPGFLQKYMPRELNGEGFSRRIIYVTEFESPKKIPFPPKGDQKLLAQIRTDIQRIYNLRGSMQFSAEAFDYYIAWHTDFEKNKNQLYPGSDLMRGYIASKDAHVKKLSMLNSVAERSDMIIEPEHIQQAISDLDEIEPRVVQAFGIRDISRQDFAMQEVLHMIPFDYWVDRGEITHKMRNAGFALRDLDFKNMIEGWAKGKIIESKMVNGNIIYRRLK